MPGELPAICLSELNVPDKIELFELVADKFPLAAIVPLTPDVHGTETRRLPLPTRFPVTVDELLTVAVEFAFPWMVVFVAETAFTVAANKPLADTVKAAVAFPGIVPASPFCKSAVADAVELLFKTAAIAPLPLRIEDDPAIPAELTAIDPTASSCAACPDKPFVMPFIAPLADILNEVVFIPVAKPLRFAMAVMAPDCVEFPEMDPAKLPLAESNSGSGEVETPAHDPDMVDAPETVELSEAIPEAVPAIKTTTTVRNTCWAKPFTVMGLPVFGIPLLALKFTPFGIISYVKKYRRIGLLQNPQHLKSLIL